MNNYILFCLCFLRFLMFFLLLLNKKRIFSVAYFIFPLQLLCDDYWLIKYVQNLEILDKFVYRFITNKWIGQLQMREGKSEEQENKDFSLKGICNRSLNTFTTMFLVYKACQYNSVTDYFIGWSISFSVFKSCILKGIISGFCPNTPKIECRGLRWDLFKECKPRLRHKEAFLNRQVSGRVIK